MFKRTALLMMLAIVLAVTGFCGTTLFNAYVSPSIAFADASRNPAAAPVPNVLHAKPGDTLAHNHGATTQKLRVNIWFTTDAFGRRAGLNVSGAPISCVSEGNWVNATFYLDPGLSLLVSNEEGYNGVHYNLVVEPY
jgi:hypothetical protein